MGHLCDAPYGSLLWERVNYTSIISKCNVRWTGGQKEKSYCNAVLRHLALVYGAQWNTKVKYRPCSLGKKWSESQNVLERTTRNLFLFPNESFRSVGLMTLKRERFEKNIWTPANFYFLASSIEFFWCACFSSVLYQLSFGSCFCYDFQSLIPGLWHQMMCKQDHPFSCVAEYTRPPSEFHKTLSSGACSAELRGPTNRGILWNVKVIKLLVPKTCL